MKARNNPRGRPTAYKDEYAQVAYNYALLGAVDTELAAFFQISKATLNTWKRKHPDFLDSITRGKMTADAEVAASTFKSATGQHFIEEERIVNQGDSYEIVTIKKQVPPDYRAQSLWLRNRRPKDWKERVEIKEESIVRLIPWDDLRQISKEALEFADTEHERVITGRAERLGITLEYGETKD
jgi:hypothetical protein